MIKLTVDTREDREPLGDLYGIFFEDLNHAADGGLYAELVQNRAFEYSVLDNRDYRPLTAWERVEEDGSLDWSISTADPVSRKNPHYLVLDITRPGSRVGVRNLGYGRGMFLQEGEEYLFSCYVRRRGGADCALRAVLTDAAGRELGSAVFRAGTAWEKREVLLVAQATEVCGRLEILAEGEGRVELDFVSLFPAKTFRGRKNGLRRDLAGMLEALKPRFLRFPGGCLTHDGALEADARDSMYRWKNTVGPLTERAARRNNWNYNQTLGLGYYEYFLLCEDIGAKPLPVLPAACNPHSGEAVPLDEMGPWIQDALDLIEFANGDAAGEWGGLRASLGHPEPFGLEYLAIGNEEVTESFFIRYALFHNAIRERYPQIRLINSAGPWAGGEVYERGWRSADENGSDLVDEHYYQSPEWFLANSRRYDGHAHRAKVFVGEYATRGNTWYNALAEAAFMTGLERNARSVGLACYAPLFANVDYVNWEPDLIWFDGHRVCGSPSYYVQKLFMNHQGAYRLDCRACGMPEPIPMEEHPGDLTGKVYLEANESEVTFEAVTLETGMPDGGGNRQEATKRACSGGSEVHRAAERISLGGGERLELAEVREKNYALTFQVRQSGNGRGFRVILGAKDAENGIVLTAGGWERENVFLATLVRGVDSVCDQKAFVLRPEQTYEARLEVCGRTVRFWMDGALLLETEFPPMELEPLYYAASRDDNGDILVKLVNASKEERPVTVELAGVGAAAGRCWAMEGWEPDAKNTLDDPEYVSPREHTMSVADGRLEVVLPACSVRVYRLTPEQIPPVFAPV